jgi:putative SOS response-associated peptidase YedK
MCGRFAITLPKEAMVQLFEAVPGNDLPDGPRFNICPTNTVAVCTAGDGARRLRGMRWGFIPHWYKKPNEGPLLINARSETVADKPAFRAAARERRCLIPADGFYEWTPDDTTKQPWYITPADGSPVVFGGIWQDWERDGQSLTTCAIVSTEAGPEMAAIHHREPLTIAPADWPLWLGEAGKGAATLMRPRPAGFWRMWRVAKAVNSNRAAGPELVEPV